MRRTAVVVAACLVLVAGAGLGTPTMGHEDDATADDSGSVVGLPGGGNVNVELLPGGTSSADGGDATGQSNASDDEPDRVGLGLRVGNGSSVVGNLTNGTDSDRDGLPDGIENETGTDPYDPDTDGDGLADGTEVELGTDPTTADSDDDGLTDGTEVDLGSNPTAADTDGDGLADGTEVELGLEPDVADTDDDGLPDAHELDLGTDPTDTDTDGDTLLDGWEVAGETPAGAQLPDSDPLSKDLYVQLDYAPGVDRADERFAADVAGEFAEMPVDNPDGSTGIDVHLREGGRINESVTFNGDNFWSLKDDHYDERLGPRAGVYHHVVIGEFDVDHVGYGEVGGKFSMVAAHADAATRRFVVVHELLHNVVGEIDAPGGCVDDPRHYCDGGWLRPEITPGEGEYLPEALAIEIESQGFAAF